MRGVIASFLVLTLLLSSSAMPLVAAMRADGTPVATSPVPDLPVPMDLSSTHPDARAELLARYVLAGGDTAMPALLAALQASGITVLRLDGGVAVPATSGAGSSALAFFDWEVISLLDLERNGLSTTLPELGSALSLLHPDLADAPVTDFLLDGIRASAESDIPELRFWARFIVALGVHESSGYDLLGADFDAAASLLDAVQMSLLVNRLVADVLVEAPGAYPGLVGNRLSFAQEDFSKAPCQLGNVEGRILSLTGIAGSVGFQKLMKYLQKAGAFSADVAAKIGLRASWVNSGSAFLQILFAWIAFSPQMSLEPPGQPLVRTKDRTPGEQRVVRLRVLYDAGNWQFTNCLRPILQLAGLDLNQAIGRNGPVEGADVAWSIPKGSSANINDPETRVTDAIIQYHGGDTRHTITDKDGVVRMTVEGVAQHETLPGSSVPVPREVQVRAAVALKSSNLFDDATSVISNMLCGGPGAVIACAASEMLLRSHLLFSANLTFQVIDWALPGGFHVTHHTRVVSSTKGVGIDITWESTLKPPKGAPDLSDMSGEGTYFGTVAVFPANGPKCQESSGEKMELGGTVKATGTRSSGYIVYGLEGTRTLGTLEGVVFGVPPDIAELGAEQVDLDTGFTTAEHTTVISVGDKCYGTVTQIDTITITTIPEDPAP
jgi:hypothetical protein